MQFIVIGQLTGSLCPGLPGFAAAEVGAWVPHFEQQRSLSLNGSPQRLQKPAIINLPYHSLFVAAKTCLSQFSALCAETHIEVSEKLCTAMPRKDYGGLERKYRTLLTDFCILV